MIHGWDETTKHADASGSQFIKLKNGERIIVAFCGAPAAQDRVFLDDHAEPFDPVKHAGMKRSARFFINVFDVAQGAMKIMEGGKPWYESVLAVRNKYGLEKHLFEVRRTGEGLKTQYAVMYHEAMSPDLARQIAETPLLDLAKAMTTDESAAPPDEAARVGRAAASSAPAEPTISAETADALIKRISLLEPEAKQKFKYEFGVTRLRDLPEARVDHVWRWLDEQAAEL